MGGKASILLVLGFSLVFLILGHNFGNVSSRATDNFSDYYDSTMAYNIAISGMNIVSNKFFTNHSIPDETQTLDFQGGQIQYSLSTVGALNNLKKIEVLGTFNGLSKSVRVYLQPSKFSRFAYFSITEGNIYWKSGDTVWGPIHAQGQLRVSGQPVFKGKASSFGGLIKNHSSDDPKFYGGYESGVDIPLPTDGIDYLDSVAVNGGKKITGQDTVYLNFMGDSINVKYGATSADTTYLGSNFTSNGVIMAEGAVVRMQGTVGGQYTVTTKSVYQPALYGTRQRWSRRCGCYRTETYRIQSAGYIGGNVFLDDDLVYQDDPRTNPNSTDILGIVAEDDIMITDNSANNNGINIHASIYSQTGGFGAENYSSRGVDGEIHLLGGIIQDTRRAVGTFNTSTQTNTSGFSKRYKYDDRFLIASPPSFPGTGSFEIVSWFE